MVSKRKSGSEHWTAKVRRIMEEENLDRGQALELYNRRNAGESRVVPVHHRATKTKKGKVGKTKVKKVRDLEAPSPLPNGYVCRDVRTERWREYDFGGRVYRIENPLFVIFSPGGSIHRVVVAGGLAHCLPAPGVHGCALRWLERDPKVPVHF